MKIEIELADLLAAVNGNKEVQQASRDMGQNIVVLDRGFVYVGNTVIEGDFVTITDCRNIAHWGTKHGLGELVNGPLPETDLNKVGTVKAPMRAVIHFIPVSGF